MANIGGSTMRLTGMASGMDTESIVKDIMAGSKLKIEAVKKQKTILEWKQEYYKDITSRLSAFQTKYFGTQPSSTLIGSSLRNLSANNSSPYVSITPGANSTQGALHIADIVSLASSAKLVSSQPVSADPEINVNTANLSELAGKSMVFLLNGSNKVITFSERTYTTSQDVQDELISQLNTAFGANKINVALQGDTISLCSTNSTLQISVPSAVEKDPSDILDFGSLASNRFGVNTSLADAKFAQNIFTSPEDTSLSFTINGSEFTFTAENTIGDIMKTLNSSSAGATMSYSTLTDTFSLVSKDTGIASSVSVQDNNGFLMNTLFGSGSYTAGTSAQVSMSTNGSTDPGDLITVIRSTNTFDVDGTSISLLGKANGDTAENINVSLKYDIDSIQEKITSFIDDYNELLSSITSKTSEEQYRDYAPLSDDEKADLSEEEIKLWTSKAKSGILRNDSYLKAIETELRSCIYSEIKAVDGSESSFGMLAQIGITTGVYSEKGKLHIDKTKLRGALTHNIEQALDLFTQSSSTGFSTYATKEQQKKRFDESGIIWRLSDIMNKNLNTIGKKGALINLVGSSNSSYTTTTEYSKRITSMENKIEHMNQKLVDEEAGYWKKFTAMETALSKLNSQSSWISNMLGQGNT